MVTLRQRKVAPPAPVPSRPKSSTPLGRLGKLPPELRVRIYNEVFRGSKITLKVVTKRNIARAAEFGKKISATPRRSGHHQLLRSSLAIYCEAVPVYWSASIVTAESFSFDGLVPCNLDLLTKGLSEVVKKNIRHLRGVRISRARNPLNGALLDGVDNPSLFAQFSNLQTVVFVEPCYYARASRKMILSNESGSLGKAVTMLRGERVYMFKTRSDMEPKEWMKEQYNLDTSKPSLNKIHFLCKQEWVANVMFCDGASLRFRQAVSPNIEARSGRRSGTAEDNISCSSFVSCF